MHTAKQTKKEGWQHFPVPMGSLFRLLAGVVAGES